METLLKSERQQLYHIYWSLWRQFSWKKSLIVICKILRLIVNKLAADDKYSLLNRDNFLQHLQMILSQKQKNIFPISFLHFGNGSPIFIISKKRWPSWLTYFWSYGLRKTWLANCPKSPDSEDPSTSNMVNGLKHCWNLNDSTLTIFFDNTEGNAVGKGLS